MKISKYTDSQILAILNQAEGGIPVPELCREHGMSSATFYKWRAKYGGMDASLMARMNGSSRKLFRKPWQKSGKAISKTRNGSSCCYAIRCHDQFGVSYFYVE